MITQLKNGQAYYAMDLGKHTFSLNDKIGSKISIRFKNVVYCIHCSKEIKKNYRDGYCLECFKSLPECDLCIVKPELCHYAEGTCRDSAWGDAHCMVSHIVYLANTVGIKVGITRKNNIPGRWIDQGAIQGLPIFEVSNRYQSGLFEQALAQVITDKTNWRNMLKDVAALNLEQWREDILGQCGEILDRLEEQLGEDQVQFLEDASTTNITYPVDYYPDKIQRFSLDKNPVIEGKLRGIKGQYLIFDSGVFNVRKASGYLVNVEI